MKRSSSLVLFAAGVFVVVSAAMALQMWRDETTVFAPTAQTSVVSDTTRTTVPEIEKINDELQATEQQITTELDTSSLEKEIDDIIIE